jgi:hypothetical protein
VQLALTVAERAQFLAQVLTIAQAWDITTTNDTERIRAVVAWAYDVVHRVAEDLQ